MKIDTILDFFYSKASQRIRKRIQKSNLKYNEIHTPDTKQISRIVNKKITKNNPYLITDSVISSSYKDEATGNIVPCGLLETKELCFNNESDILWGTEDEILSYTKDLFLLLWSEVTDDFLTYNIDKELYLCDYVPYAKYSSYWNILFSKENQFPAITYGISEDTVTKNLDYARNNALSFLYQKCQLEYEQLFLQFAKDTVSFHKIDKVFHESFIKKTFVPMIKRYIPNDDSLGLRVRNLITVDLSHCASLLFNSTLSDFEYKKHLISASSEYILALERIQETLYKKTNWN